MKISVRLGIIALIGLMAGCKETKITSFYTESEIQPMLPSVALFTGSIEGKETGLYRLTNNKGLIASITNYGGRVVGLIVPDKNGDPVDVVIGMESPAAYQASSEAYFGALIGRVGNRIAKGKFVLDDQAYELSVNNGENTLHGGVEGYQSVVWQAEQPNDSTLILNYTSPNGDQGFPGELKMKVTYTATSRQGLKIEYDASSDQNTLVNLTNHAFFNLNGEGNGQVNEHVLTIFANEYTPIDSGLIPLGTIEQVENTAFDFRVPTTIGKRLNDESSQLAFGSGYDHNFVLTKLENSTMSHAANVRGDLSGVVMDVYTTEPGLQFYGGNFMQGLNELKSGAKDEYRTAFCLETQHFPDAPNQPNFPSIKLNAGEQYQTVSEYVFSVYDSKETP